MIYTVFLILHSWLRWLVVAAGAFSLVKAVQGKKGELAYDKRQGTARLVYVASLHLTLVVGVLLYFVFSPLTQAGLADMKGAMKDPVLRFFVVEHVFGMLIAVVLGTVGSVKVRRAASDAAKHKATLVFIGLSLVVLLLSIPWPFYPAGRPLFRLLY